MLDATMEPLEEMFPEIRLWLMVCRALNAIQIVELLAGGHVLCLVCLRKAAAFNAIHIVELRVGAPLLSLAALSSAGTRPPTARRLPGR